MNDDDDDDEALFSTLLVGVLRGASETVLERFKGKNQVKVNT